jgi:hypothetical protein
MFLDIEHVPLSRAKKRRKQRKQIHSTVSTGFFIDLVCQKN